MSASKKPTKKEEADKRDKKRAFIRLTLLFWVIVLGGILVSVGLFYGISNDVIGTLPSTEELENPKSNLASVIYSSDRKILGQYFTENRVNIRYDELSPFLVDALIATEDERYREHSGIDPRGTARAVAYMGGKGGASTITQQLAKMLFHKREGGIKRLFQKLQEWVISAKLERAYTKDEIVTMYFNKFDFVNNAVGVRSASYVYFAKNPWDLNLQEAAMLVGMAKNPALFNPIRRPDTTLHRRNVVLYQMVRNERLTMEEFDSLKAEPLGIDFRPVNHQLGLAPYFREELRLKMHGILKMKDEHDELVYAKPDGSAYNIYRDGLKIYTTIDSRMQKYAEWAVSEHLSKELQPDFWRDLKRQKNPPFDNRLGEKSIAKIMLQAQKRTRQYKVFRGKLCPKFGVGGKNIEEIEVNGEPFWESTFRENTHRWAIPTEDSIAEYFDTPKEMTIFSWNKDIDTTMTPNDSIRYYKSILQCGFTAIDPHTGHVKAWVGGVNFRHFAYDHVYRGRRQVGSTFKPFVYALAMENGLSPCHEIPNVPYTIEKGKWGLQKDWTPKNAGYDFDGMVSLKFGLANSMNNVTAWVMERYGPHAVTDFAQRVGLPETLEPVPSLCLGVADLSVLEMVAANCTFANKGVFNEPTFITRIEDKNGNVVVEFRPVIREAMSEETAYTMLSLMKGVVDGVRNPNLTKAPWKPGTGMRLRGRITERRPYAGHHYPIAGKTGTTQNHSDGWFMGITHDLVAGCWVGAEDRGVRFRTLSKGMGTNMALPIWGYFMQKCREDKSLELSWDDFEKPEGGLPVLLDCDQWEREQNFDTFGGEDEDEFSMW